MPLIKIEHLANVTWGIWEAAESEDFFLSKIPQGYMAGYQPERFSERRRKEFLASRWLLKQILKDEQLVIAPDAQGKLKDVSGKFDFSLSHSGNRVAAIVSARQQVGIDIEEIHPRVKKVMHKFLNLHEKNLLGPNPELWRIMLCWSAKESVYKMAETPGLSFADEIELDLPVEPSGRCTARVRLRGLWRQIDMQYENAENFVLTWCAENNITRHPDNKL